MNDGINLGLADKVALVTGSGAGIGREIAGWLARAGCRIAANDIDAERAEQTGIQAGRGAGWSRDRWRRRHHRGTAR